MPPERGFACFHMRERSCIDRSLFPVAVTAVVFVLALVFRIPVAIPSGILLVFTVVGLGVSWNRYRKGER